MAPRNRQKGRFLKKSVPTAAVRNASVGSRSPVYFNAVDMGTHSYCSGWWTTPPQAIKPNITVTLKNEDIEDVEEKKSQFTWWSFEYMCPTTQQPTQGPTGIDLDREDGSLTIYWRAPRCRCQYCRTAIPYEKKAPGNVLFDGELIIEKGK